MSWLDTLLPLEKPGEGDLVGEPVAESHTDTPDALPDTPTIEPIHGDNWPRCEVCGNEVTWGGRGRRPKRCDEHKTRTSTTGRTGGTSRTTAHTARLKKIEESLGRSSVRIGVATGRYLPVTGLLLIQRGSNFARAAVKVAENHPQALDWLEAAADKEAYIEVAEMLGALAFAVGIDVGRVNPESWVSQLFGLDDLWRTYQESVPLLQEDTEPEYDENVNGYKGAKAPQFGPGLLPTFTPIGDLG